MKTKQQEIEVIENAISQLGKESYLGPWLESVKFELEAMMRADCFPNVSLSESRELADKIERDANRKAEAIVSNAKNEADRLVSDARRTIAIVFDRARGALHRALSEIR